MAATRPPATRPPALRPPAAQTAPAPVARREPLRGLTVLYDPHCRVCAFVGAWLAGQRKLIPLRLVPVGSEQARRLFPALDHEGATRREITAVGDAGQVYVGDSAWVVCLWALADHRALAHTMTTPGGRRLARAAMLGVARYRDAQLADASPRTEPARTEPARTQPARTAWVYDGAGGWTVQDAEPQGACADGCAPPGQGSP